ncbi:uncharacterized protein [Procambarus clarkii]|uniref:uncharacterized protein n=1 Tax=Procambarus clarkii TaxID=6728 RepID=UPI003744A5E7
MKQPYLFKFNINDEIGGVRFAEIEERDELGQVQGAYTYVRPDDVLVVVQYTADEDGFHPQIHEEPAPKFETNPSGTSTYSVLLPYADEYEVVVTGDQLRHYQQQALQRQQQSAQVRQTRENGGGQTQEEEEDGGQGETTEHQPGTS